MHYSFSISFFSIKVPSVTWTDRIPKQTYWMIILFWVCKSLFDSTLILLTSNYDSNCGQNKYRICPEQIEQFWYVNSYIDFTITIDLSKINWYAFKLPKKPICIANLHWFSCIGNKAFTKTSAWSCNITEHNAKVFSYCSA